MTAKQDLYDMGEAPPLGHVPPKMHAFVIRQDRFGPPVKGFQREVLETPSIADDEVLVYVMAAGVNYNNVWASLGVPVDVIGARTRAGEKEPFHIGGSDASGVVYAVGKDVTHLKVGDEVVVHCGSWSRDCPMVKAGVDPMYSPTFRIWGYETNFGSFAQFTRVQAHQCLPKPKHLTWEASAAYMLVGATAYRMLLGWPPNVVKPDEVALIWGGAGGLGSMAIQIARAIGAIPVAVVSSPDKFAYCKELGARGCLNRNDFDHWGMLPHWKDEVGYASWLKGVRKFGKAIWDVVGAKKNPTIIFEHPGETTIPTSIFACETGGMVVICAGTTGFNATVDLRYLWMRQKRLQGSHFANDEQATGLNQLVVDGHVDPCLSRTFTFDELPDAHQLMYTNRHPHGNMAVLVGSKALGLGATEPSKPRVSMEQVSPPRAMVRQAAPPVAAGFAAVDERAPAREFHPDNTPVRKIMRPFVISIFAEASAADAVQLMDRHGIHGLVVVDPAGAPIGVVSQVDLVLGAQGRTPEEARALKVRSLMTPDVVSCGPDTSVSEAVTILTRRRVHRLAVVEGGKLVGFLSLTDIVNQTIAKK